MGEKISKHKYKTRQEDPHPQSTTGTSPRWDIATKRIVAISMLLALAFAVYLFSDLILPIAVAVLLAFILNPVVDFLERHLHSPRGLATGLVFLVLVIVLLAIFAAPVTAVPSIRRAILSLQIDLNRIITDIGAFFERPVEIMEYELDLSQVYEELSASLQRFVGTVAQRTLDFALGIASGAFWLIFVLITSFYLVRDVEHIIEKIDQLTPPGYGEDVKHLRQQIADVWASFIRGQLVLGSAMGIVTAILGIAIGLPYAWAMGILIALMEFVPNLGPFIAAAPAILIALIQGSSHLPLGNFWFAVLVAIIYLILQQIENNFFVPRILGRNLNLHPLVVLVAILAGGQRGGILGMLLAAPTIGTLRVFGRYILCRLYDRDPFIDDEIYRQPEKEVSRLSLVKKVSQAALNRFQKKLKIGSKKLDSIQKKKG
jgi:predicted PurR-regulated permease PerM